MAGSTRSSPPPNEGPAPSGRGPGKRGRFRYDAATRTLTVHANRLTRAPIDTAYRVDPLDVHPDIGTAAVRLVVLLGENFSSYDLVRRPWGWTCECPDFVKRKSDKGDVCKHLGAALAAGVIDG